MNRKKGLKYKRVILKISGEILGGEKGGLDSEVFRYLVQEVISVYKLGLKIGIVLGGGNIIRGNITGWFNRIDADLCGMLGTIINGITLLSLLKEKGVDACLRSNLEIKGIVPRFNILEDRILYDRGTVMLFVGGTGNPLFTTDTAAAIKACEMDADLLIKGTKVEGVFSDDPLKTEDVRLYHRIRFQEVIDKNLKVMDMSAFNICKDANIPVCVYNFMKYSLKKIISGERIGTIIT